MNAILYYFFFKKNNKGGEASPERVLSFTKLLFWFCLIEFGIAFFNQRFLSNIQFISLSSLKMLAKIIIVTGEISIFYFLIKGFFSEDQGNKTGTKLKISIISSICLVLQVLSLILLIYGL